MLGPSLWALAAVIVLGLLMLARNRDRDSLYRSLGLLTITLLAWAIPTKMDVKQEYFGTTFQWLLVFAALQQIHLLLRHGGLAGPIVLACLIPFTFAFDRLEPRPVGKANRVVQERHRLVNDVYHALSDEHFPPYTRIYLTSTGSLSAGVLDYYHLRDTLTPLNIDDSALTDDLARHAAGIRSADYVIASEQGNGEAWEGFVRSGNVQDQTLAIVRASPDFKLLRTFPTRTGKHYFLFKRTTPFFGYLRATGLTQPTTSPNDRLLATDPSSTLVISGDDPYDNLRLILTAQSPAKTTMTILFDAKPLATWTVTPTPQTLTAPLHLTAGGQHQLQFHYDPPPIPSSQIIFTQLKLLPDDRK